MEASMKYPLNPLAACFVPLSMKTRTGNINRDSYSIDFRNSTLNKLKCPVPSTEKTKTTGLSKVKNLDLISKRTTLKGFCLTSKKCEESALVHARATPEKLIGDEASTDRSEDRTSVEKVDLMEQDITDGSSELERTSNMANENTDSFEKERTSDVDENTDSIKMNWTSNMAHENTDSETVKVKNVYTTLENGEKLVDCDTKLDQNASLSSTESVQSTKSYQSDYGTDVENLETEDFSGLPTEMLTDFKSQDSVGSERENTHEFVPVGSERDSNLQIKSNNTLSLYKTAVLSSNFPPKNGKENTSSKENLQTGSKLERKCTCPPMFGWILPFEYFGNPLNLNGTCKNNFVHSTYKHAIYDRKASVQTIYSKSLDYENHSIDSGHWSDEDEPLSSVGELNTLEQCSSELESIIKDVFDCVDKLCGDEKPQTDGNKNPEVWITVNETEVVQGEDSPLIDDGYHPLLEESNSEDEINLGISVIEKFLGEAFTFGNKQVIEPQSSCIPPCSVWCTNVPPSVIDTYKRFVKKVDSDPVNCDVADKKVFRKPLYKRCFSANDTPKGFDKVQSLASSWKPRAEFYEQDFAAFVDSKGTSNINKNLSSSFPFGQQTNPLKEGSDKWSFYDGADSLWQPLPDCVLSNDHSEKYAYKRARIMRRQKSVG